VVDARQTAPVAGFSSSATGAFDLSGNLLQWQHDRWSEAPSAGVDAQGSVSGSDRVARGGSWFLDLRDARVAFRGGSPPGIRDYYLGFRLLRASS
jgi:formylglycine-generating enzyme required for sulfatase activity